MDFKDFQAGIYKQEYQYKSFLPCKIDHTFTWNDPAINTKLEEAIKILSELDTFAAFIPNIDIFIQMHIIKEANTSSKIEGTRTEMDDILIPKEQLDPEKRDDWQEVQNYIEAINYAVKELQNLPLSNRLIKKTHEVLLSGVRGASKQPGEFRKSQNWIGGSSIKNASFIPPSHNEVADLMSDLEKFLHNQEIFVPHLIKIAIAHYQFETIHPFLDGNGRMGRLLITLYLISSGLLKKPSLYLSDYIEKNKNSYYEALTIVRTKNDIAHWVKFFLDAVIFTANSSVLTFKSIVELKQKMDAFVLKLGRKAQNANNLIEFLYKTPIISVNDIIEPLGISKQTANQLVKDFRQEGILKEMTGFERNKRFMFKSYVYLFIS
ncbi:MAG: Fic family protein [Campylobacteraceae bacterium]|jgi:Fic family protein|nr:Fic family protein [Campylobacteraceae bacterium]